MIAFGQPIEIQWAFSPNQRWGHSIHFDSLSKCNWRWSIFVHAWYISAIPLLSSNAWRCGQIGITRPVNHCVRFYTWMGWIVRLQYALYTSYKIDGLGSHWWLIINTSLNVLEVRQDHNLISNIFDYQRIGHNSSTPQLSDNTENISLPAHVTAQSCNEDSSEILGGLCKGSII